MKITLPVLSLTALASALPQTTSAPPSFKITNVISGGTGCPQGSIDVNWTDNKILPIYFGKEFTAAVGPKADITDSRKFCQLNLQLEYTPGYSFAVYSAEYTGFADLDAGVTGTVKSTYYFSGSVDQVRDILISLLSFTISLYFPSASSRHVMRTSTATNPPVHADILDADALGPDESEVQEAG
ncbi:hypothetical protein EKO04_010005 [Ascochyta lentis]|uniref:Uncharacterized protein n=1 Tax=Ascochyta lentis TaxID=205686 RepID=A0A8H7MED5_9PLEO|nr:hypothetical protein EKO04_010005 [Ascochyta lentis]